MGTKDNPHKSNRILIIIIIVFAIALVASTTYGIVNISKLSKLEEKVNHQKKRLDQQGSLIDQKDKEMKALEEATLKAIKRQQDLTKKAVEKKDKVIDEQSKEIDKLTNTVEQQKQQISLKKAQKEKAKVLAVNSTKKEAPAAIPSRGSESQGKTLSVKATAYTAYCQGCSGTTSTGIDLRANPDAKVIAVDPAVIPTGTKVHVENYGYAVAADVGGGINGHEIDVFIPDTQDAYKFGVQQLQVRILN